MKKSFVLSLSLLSAATSLVAKEDVHPCKAVAHGDRQAKVVTDVIKAAPLALLGFEWQHVLALGLHPWFDSLAQHETKSHLKNNSAMSKTITTLTNRWAQIVMALTVGYAAQKANLTKSQILAAALATVYGMNGTAIALHEVDKAL